MSEITSVAQLRRLRPALSRFWGTTEPAAARLTLGMWVLAAAGVTIVGLAPYLFDAGTVLLMGEALILALFALSLNLLVGTTGLMSFGHAAYYGFGAYTVGLLATREGWSVLTALALAPLVGAVAAFVSGLVVLRGSELYFGLLTLGIAQLYWAIAQGWVSLTGGQNGLPGILPPDWMLSTKNLYWFVYACVLGSAAALYLITRSPFGSALRGIRENRRRAEFVGLRIRRYELAAFVIAGAFAAIAGGLSAIFEGLASAASMQWQNSSTPLIVSLIGGIGQFLGPAAGAIFYTYLQNYVVAHTVLWDLVIGIVVLAIALLMPSGMLGALRWLGDRLLVTRGRARVSSAAAQTTFNGTIRPRARHPAHRPSAASAVASSRTGTPMLVARNLTKAFGGLHAVNGASIDVHEGTMHAIIGPNGAGKSTLFNLLTGLIRPDAGQVVFDGEDITGASPPTIVRLGVGRSFQQATLFWSLTCKDNLVLARASARGITHRVVGRCPPRLGDEADELLHQVGISPLSSIPARELSHGDQRSLELAAALAVDSRLLLLDEPTAGLSPTETRTAVELIRRVAKAEHLTVLFVEHDMDVVFGVADWITVLHRGSVLAEGTPIDIRGDPEVQAAYLGADDVKVGG